MMMMMMMMMMMLMIIIVVVVVIIEKCLHFTESGIAYWVSRLERVPKIAIQLQTM
jgi:uncharacterized protein YqfA (UPF0365 family)